ncbi:MAG: NAD(P)/FAD-dependent oxidoreductase [Chitinispirillales bacterium]|jgi:glutathione reductase (NADPH)|nr:NAD(P)/FAD-dependent oxidoreductase [Chitinispirillales bacterium]
MKHYDLFVIGSGSGGCVAANICRRAGFRVGIAEKRSIGGIGAVAHNSPQKNLVAAAEIAYRVGLMNGKGIKGEISVDWERLKGERSEQSGLEEELRSSGIEIYRGFCRFNAMNVLEVAGEKIYSRFILIAAGARPVKFSFVGSEHLISSWQFMNMPSLPSSIVFVGGGYISFEFAHIAARAGSKVTIIEAAPRPLRTFDDQLVDILVQESRAAGIEVFTGAPLTSIEKQGSRFRVHAGANRIEADLIVHGAGRVPDIEELNLGAGYVSTNEQGIAVNRYLQSVSNPAVYIAGDVNSTGIQLKPVAEMESAAAASNMLLSNNEMPDYSAAARALLTSPPLCAVGMGEKDAALENIPFDISFFDNFSDSKAACGTECSRFAFKIISEKGTGRILGAHILGHNAQEAVNGFSIAIRGGCTIKELKTSALAFPSVLYNVVNSIK